MNWLEYFNDNLSMIEQRYTERMAFAQWRENLRNEYRDLFCRYV